ncbi:MULTISPECIES: MerR family transcriptional regulator [Sulfitobacter]|uniref:MerR family transcriptional regulator n=1 Tax=Sulfitobacter TaxID=60136 RepID=UPI0007C25825|nr:MULTISPECIES: MerR family transcriptional regulator [Sulfitobacter]KZY54120.1 methyltransferase [Sulfitobacter sp. HI0054]MBO9440248.1 MerR family transcriptional regulator [Sulfitobacter sp. R18_2]MDH4539589.1 methyltransferase [Sulfitobacter faviae]TKA84475.1 MerR family transcriptional regulator [Sulfitobacter sp. 15WGC]
MYRISELAESVGLSRTTLLYYEKLGLLKGKRQANGYRVYSDADRQRLRLMQQLQAGGLSLEECQVCLDGKLDREMLGHRLETLEREITEKTRSRDLLAALLGRGSLKDWHEELERVAPELHRAWLMMQGFSSEEAARVAWLSRDMNAHDDYMACFMDVFSSLDWWGPATEVATRKALAMVPFAPRTILEIGCGPGMATMVLAEATSARILATDTDAGALERLRERLATADLGDRVAVRNMDMAQLPLPDAPWDVIWAEGSAYIIGVESALRNWRPLLRPGGALVFSEMVWRTETPPEELRAYWASAYPAMTRVPVLLAQAKRAGFRLLGHFDMGREAMDTYYRPLEARVAEMEQRLEGTRVVEDLRAELAAYHACDGIVSFEMFVLQKS